MEDTPESTAHSVEPLHPLKRIAILSAAAVFTVGVAIEVADAVSSAIDFIT